MQDYSIERAGIPNLDFTGDLIGQSAGPAPVVKIYRTKALKYVGELRANQKLAEAQGGFNTPQDLVNWFKGFNYGAINPDVQEAIEAATKNDEPFKTAWNVQIS
jgi:hypothetical protein